MRKPHHIHKPLLISTILTGLAAGMVPHFVSANPAGGVVAQGAADIVANGSTLNITQHTQKAVIDWTSFNIGAGEHTQFHQPSSSAVALNRVNDVNPSQILGQLSANGNLILINPNGVFFGAGSRVDVNSLIATTADIDNDDFIADNFTFSPFKTKGKPTTGSIINHGTITAKDAGLIGLVAPQVENHGVIEARLGRAILASSEDFTIDLYGDGLIHFTVGNQVKDQIIKNTGNITAKGGSILLTAAAGKNIVDSLLTIEGELHAPAVYEQGGKIIIAAANNEVNSPGNKTAQAEKSTVILKADVDVSGLGDGQRGGSIEITGAQIALLNGTRLDASGHTGQSGTTDADNFNHTRANAAGGDIKVGGDYMGTGDTPTAKRLYVENGVEIHNSATHSGDAGRSIFWSDYNTSFAGTLTATGGAGAGNGGFVEISGADLLSFSGSVDLRSPTGHTGSLFLDPTDITISTAADTASLSFMGGVFSDTVSSSSNINVGTLTTQLGLSNVMVSTASALGGAGDITIASNINWASGFGLDLQADNDINVNAAITNTGSGFLTLTAGGDGAGNINIAQDIDVGGLLTLTATGGAINLTGQSDLAGNGITLHSATNFNTSAGFTRTIDAGTGIFTNNAPVNLLSKSLNLIADDVAINDTIDNTLIFSYLTGTVGRSIGLAGGAGDASFSTAELDNITSPFRYQFGSATNGGDITVGSYSWPTSVSFFSSSSLNITGAQTFSASSILEANDFQITAALASSAPNLASLRIESRNDLSFGGSAGSTNIDSTELDFFADGFSQLDFGFSKNADITFEAYANWRDPVRLVNNRNVIINGDQATAAGSNGTFEFRNTGALTRINGDINTSANNGAIQFINHATSRVELGADLISGNGVLSLSRQIDLIGAAGETRTLNAGTNDVNILKDINVFDKHLRIINDDIDIRSNVIATTGAITIAPSSSSVSVGVGDGATGLFKLFNTDLDKLDAGSGTLTIGNAAGNNLTRINTAHVFDENITFESGTGTIFLQSDVASNQTNITFNGRTQILQDTTITTGGAGTITFNNDINGIFNNGESLTLSAAGGGVVFNAGIGNSRRLNQLDIQVNNALTLPELFATSLFARTFSTNSDITLSGVQHVDGTGTALELVSGRNILNNHGAGVFDITGVGARFLTWSADPINDIGDEHFAPATQKRYNRHYGDAVEAGANIRNYAIAPVLTVTPDNPAYTYGDAAIAPTTFSISTDFHEAEDAGVHATSGTGIFQTSYAQGNNAGTAFTVNDNGSTFLSNLGYSYAFAQPTGSLVVAKANVGVRAPNLTITQGDVPNIPFIYEASDFLLGDTALTAGISGAPDVLNVKYSTVSPGSYALELDPSTAISTNYNFIESFPRGILTVLAPTTPAPGTVGINSLPATVRFATSNADRITTIRTYFPLTTHNTGIRINNNSQTTSINLYDTFNSEIVAATPDNITINNEVMEFFGLTYQTKTEL